MNDHQRFLLIEMKDNSLSGDGSTRVEFEQPKQTNSQIPFRVDL